MLDGSSCASCVQARLCTVSTYGCPRTPSASSSWCAVREVAIACAVRKVNITTRGRNRRLSSLFSPNLYAYFLVGWRASGNVVIQ